MTRVVDPRLQALTERIIGAAFEVSNHLGHGFLEAVYRNALSEELAVEGLEVRKERSYPVIYKGKQVGFYVADLLVDEQVIVELKAVPALAPSHRAQLLNYLRASGLPAGLLLNFGTPKIEVRRVLL